MENLLKDAKFGDKFVTESGLIGILISYNQRKRDPYVIALQCYLDDSVKSICYNYDINGCRNGDECSEANLVARYDDVLDDSSLNAVANEMCGLYARSAAFIAGFERGYKFAKGV